MEVRIILNPDRLEMLRGTDGVALTYSSQEEFKRDVQQNDPEEQPVIKRRAVIDTAKLGQIAELLSRLPRLTCRELALLTGISESTLKQNSKVRQLWDMQKGSAYSDATDRYHE